MTELIDEKHEAWTVSQLIAFLQRCDGDAVVVLSKDAEGNAYSPLSVTGTTYYIAETTWSGEINDEAIDEVPAVAFWPIS